MHTAWLTNSPSFNHLYYNIVTISNPQDTGPTVDLHGRFTLEIQH